MKYCSYLCLVIIKFMTKLFMKIKYFNGFIDEACLSGLKDFGQVENAIVVAKCEGSPFRGNPMEMANDILKHLLGKFRVRCGVIPIVYECNSEIDDKGIYTTQVVFQASRHYF